MDFHEDFADHIPGRLSEKLKSHTTSFRRKTDESKDAKLNPTQIKEFRELFETFQVGEVNAWLFLCRYYLEPRLTPVWDDAVSFLGVSFLTSRANETTPYLNQKVQWEDAVKLMGKYGIASADAMILNMFLSSNIPLLLTSDVEMAKCVLNEVRNDKSVFLPDSLAKKF